MPDAVQAMLKKYELISTKDRLYALREIIQEIALLGLYRAGFFNKAAFYGGSALRIFHAMPRFSEDLDFSLVTPDRDFNFTPYAGYIINELAAFGFDITFTPKVKSLESAVKTAFIKTNAIIHLKKITSGNIPITGVNPDELMKIKLEIDIDPPPSAQYEVKYQLNPVPYSVQLFTLPSLFAGKLHALLFRSWKNRVKGRDFYDYTWFLANNIPVDLIYLTSRLKRSGQIAPDSLLTPEQLKEMLHTRFQKIDYNLAKQDAKEFLKNPQLVKIWSPEFFQTITEDKLKIK
jgi:uncharacterized protein YqgQ